MSLRLDNDLAKALDRRRGLVPRETYIKMLILRDLNAKPKPTANPKEST